MGCQMQSHGAALKAIQAAYGHRGLFLGGLGRQEQPYDVEDYPNSRWRSIFVTTVAEGLPGQIRELARLERGSDDCWDPVITGAPGELLVAWLRDENPPRLFCSTREMGG